MKKRELVQKMRSLANSDCLQLTVLMKAAGLENSAMIEELPMIAKGLKHLATTLIRKPKTMDELKAIGDEILDVGRRTLDFNFGLRTLLDSKSGAHPQLFIKALKFGDEVMAALRECKEMVVEDVNKKKPHREM